MPKFTETQDIIKYITYFGSQNSYTEPFTIADNEFVRLINVYHKGSKIARRYPHKLFVSNNNTVNLRPVGIGVYRTPDESYVVWGSEDGKLWRCKNDGTDIQRIYLAGLNPLDPGNRISIVQYGVNLFLVDQTKFLYINVLNNTATDLTTRITSVGSGITEPYKLIVFANRLWVFDSQSKVLASKSDADILGDINAFDFTTVGTTGFFSPIQGGDAEYITSAAVGNSTLIINKSLERDSSNSSYKITGSSQLDFTLKQISSSISCLGESIASVGSKLLGLTQSRFEYLTTIEDFGTSATTGTNSTIVNNSNFQTGLIPDFVKDLLKDLNTNFSDICVGIYNPLEEAYYCAFPYGSSEVNNMVVRIDLTNNQTRMSIFTNTNAQFFFWINGLVHFIDEYGNIWKMMSLNETNYEEPSFTSLIVTKAYPIGDGTVKGRFLSFIPSFITFKESQSLRMFSEVRDINTLSGVVKINTTKKGKDITSGTYNCKQVYSFYPSRYDLSIYNMDRYDSQVFNVFHKEVTVNNEGNFGSLIIVDDSSDPQGTGSWELESLKIKCRPEAEAL